MTTKQLRWIAIILPGLFLGALFFLRTYFSEAQSAWLIEAILFVFVIVGAVAFSTWVFSVVEDGEAEIKARTRQLQGLHEAALSLTTELDLAAVLQKVVDLARGLVQARYGGLGVLDTEGEFIDQFITSGIAAEQRAKMGPPPRGHGILGLIIRNETSMIIPEIGRSPDAHGFPPNHPPMQSFLGVPIKSKGKVFGNLYLTDKTPLFSGGPEAANFTKHDQQILEMFATQAAIAIENAQLYRQTQQLAILQERERIGMNLHDGIIQSIYAIGLMLEDTQHRLQTSKPEESAAGINHAIRGLNEVIRDIRNYILDLRPQRFQGRDLYGGLEELMRDLKANSFLDVELSAENEALAVSPEYTVEILHIVQEALTNVRKHARATKVRINLAGDADGLRLGIEDNGSGIPAGALAHPSGNGLSNIRERIKNLHGSVHFSGRETGGTRIILSIPLKK